MANGISPTAQSALDALFASYGSPLPILSGYRDPETNARVGGASGSQHLHGNAFDVDVSGLSQAERINLANMARSAGFQGFGFYDNSMHFDVGAPRAWGPDYSSGSIPSWARDWTSQNLGGGAAPLAATMSTRGTGMNGMDQQRPGGLLEFMGIQRRDPSAEGETALPFYERPRFADFMGGLAVGLNELRQQPSQAIPGIVAAGQERRRDDRQRNATAEWIASQGRADLAEGIRNGSLTAAQAMQMMQRPSPIEVDGRLVDPTTFEVLYESPPEGPDNEAIRAARNEFTSLPAIRTFAEQTSAYGRVVTSAADPSPAGDLALIFNYMKMLDPGSVVREGEFATAQNAGGVDERTRSFYNRVVEGTRLSEGQREDFVDRSTRLYTQAEEQYTSLADQYRAFAEAAGLPVDQVIPDFRFTGERPRAEAIPPTPEGYTRQAWAEVWRNMTPEERQAFVEAGQ